MHPSSLHNLQQSPVKLIVPFLHAESVLTCRRLNNYLKCTQKEEWWSDVVVIWTTKLKLVLFQERVNLLHDFFNQNYTQIASTQIKQKPKNFLGEHAPFQKSTRKKKMYQGLMIKLSLLWWTGASLAHMYNQQKKTWVARCFSVHWKWVWLAIVHLYKIWPEDVGHDHRDAWSMIGPVSIHRTYMLLCLKHAQVCISLY